MRTKPRILLKGQSIRLCMSYRHCSRENPIRIPLFGSNTRLTDPAYRIIPHQQPPLAHRSADIPAIPLGLEIPILVIPPFQRLRLCPPLEESVFLRQQMGLSVPLITDCE